MFNRLLPQRIDNSYHGHRAALWIFALLVLIKTGISLGSIFNGYQAASGADGIPLDTYTPVGAQAVVSLFALLGFAHLVICLLCVAALARYRSLIPFMFALLLFEHAGRKLILYILPIARTGVSTGFVVNLVILALIIAGLILSLWHRRDPSPSL